MKMYSKPTNQRGWRPIVQDVDYPLAELRRCQIKDIPTVVLDEFVKPAKVHVNQGSWCVDSGVSYVGVRVPSMKLGRKCIDSPQVTILGYNWPTKFGRIFSFSLAVPGVGALSCCRTLVPFADSAVQILRNSGIVIIVIIYGNQALAAFNADFLVRPGSRRGMLKVMAYDEEGVHMRIFMPHIGRFMLSLEINGQTA